jgi:hypothetical protein
MGLDFYAEAFEHRKLADELHDTPWWRSLMKDERFQKALERNYHMRLKMGEAAYLKKLLRSERERQSFVYNVLHPASEDLATPDEAED